MPFRITPQAIQMRSLYDMTNGYARLADAQMAISSAKRLRVLSDDTAAAAHALDLRTTILRSIQSRSSVDDATRAADTQAEMLEEASDLIAQARALGESAASDAMSESDLAAITTEIDAILDQLVALGNQRLEGRYLFAGSQTETKPFVVAKSFGKIIGVSYAGDDVVRQVRIGPDELKEIELSGRQAFLAMGRDPTILVGGTGLLATKGAQDTLVGTANVTVLHTATTIGDGALGAGGDTASGIALGASTAQDSILGPSGAHVLTVTTDGAGGGTIALDDGEAMPYDGTETDLMLVNGMGDKVHVDLTALTPGFQGTVDLAGAGTIQVDGGAPQALTFTSDFVLQDAGGRAMHLDTTGVLRSGDTFAVFPGTQSIFDALIGLREELTLDTGLSPEDRTNRIQARLGLIDSAHDELVTGLASLGARSASFQRVSATLDFFELSLENKRSDLEDTDLIAASVDLAESQNVYQAALAAASKLLAGPTLLNFL